MKLRSELIALSLVSSIAGFSAPAQAQAPDPCSLYMCMAGISGQGTAPPECTSIIAYWHVPYPGGLAYWTYYPAKFWPNVSYNLRQQYMNSCPGVSSDTNNSSIANTILNQWGRVP